MSFSLKKQTESILERLNQDLSISQILEEYCRLDRTRNNKWRLTTEERDILDKTYRAIDSALDKAKAAQPQELSKTPKQSTTYYRVASETSINARNAAADRFYREKSRRVASVKDKGNITTRVPDFSQHPSNICAQTGVLPLYRIPVFAALKSSRTQNIIEKPTERPQSQSVSETERLVELIAKETEAQTKEQMLKKQEEKASRELQSISQRLDSTTLALKSEENIVRMQAKEIEMLRKKNDQLIKKSVGLTAEAGNVSLALYENTRLVDKQNLEIEELKNRYDKLQREKEEWKSKYQSVLHSNEQDTYSMEQFGNALKNVLINNDLILESLKGIQKDPEEKKKLMIGHSETFQLLREQEHLNLRVRELEEQLKENEDLDRFDFDFCDAVDDSFYN
ncbi:hypothetical protein CAEBREN_16922 [Caenorhabditis brenneri]|uniref:Uncharacterized protein n=1 Tax=Caenorhabditis brenneri TaxID=135651 RepID=G0NRZ6_CAEBE|nr:hypothetical protein CAEBREN_16922 [Caenorhabditis brenneri]